MVRRAQQGKRALQRARDETERQLGSDKGSYRPPPREVCDPKSWYQTFDDASTVRVSIMLWRQNGRLVDFVILVELSAWNAWTEVSRIDCCHGFCQTSSIVSSRINDSCSASRPGRCTSNQRNGWHPKRLSRLRVHSETEESIMTEEISHRLDQFRSEINYNLALGILANEQLPVVDDRGEVPVVAALGGERLAVLLRRVAAVGGYANVFIDNGDAVRVLSFIDESCAIESAEAEDLASDDNRPGADATVSMFLAYLELKPRGVRLPADIPARERAYVPVPREVVFA